MNSRFVSPIVKNEVKSGNGISFPSDNCNTIDFRTSLMFELLGEVPKNLRITVLVSGIHDLASFAAEAKRAVFPTPDLPNMING